MQALATKWIRSAAPTFEPIELPQAKKQCAVAQEDTFYESDFLDWIKAAREQVEKDASIALCTGTFTRTYHEFGWGEWFELSDLLPITAITSITYVDSNGTATPWGASNYSLDQYTAAPIVKLAYGQSWPTVRGDIGGITVTVTAGYATPALIPYRAKQAVKMLVGHWYDNREAVLKGMISKDIEFGYEFLIKGLRREVYG